MRNKDETELLYRSLRGEKDAWGEIVRRYREAVYGISLAVLKDGAEAEDVTQEAFIKAWNNLEKYDMDRNFSTWLFTVASNISKNVVRKRERWSYIKDLTRLGGKSDPDKKWKEDRRKKKVKSAVMELDRKYRVPLVLRFWRECSYKEIAEILDIPEGTVKTYLHRGKERLKGVYEEGVEVE